MPRAGEESGSGKLSFKEKLPHHVNFTMCVVMEWDHLYKCRSESRKKYVSGLKPGVGLPHRATCVKIMKVIKMLMSQKLSEELKILVHELGLPCVGAQADIFSLKNCSEARLWLRSSRTALRILTAFVACCSHLGASACRPFSRSRRVWSTPTRSSRFARSPRRRTPGR